MKYADRLASLNTMLEENPKDVFVHYALGLEYFSLQKFNEAADFLTKCVELQKDYFPAYYQLGKVFESCNELEKAIHYFKIGLEYAKQQKQQKAVNEFSEAIYFLEE